MQLIQTREALIMDNEIRTAIKKIYGMLWDVLSLYEKTERYNSIPKDEKITEKDIWDFIGDKLLLVRKDANSGSSDHAFRYELIRLSGCN